MAPGIRCVGHLPCQVVREKQMSRAIATPQGRRLDRVLRVPISPLLSRPCSYIASPLLHPWFLWIPLAHHRCLLRWDAIWLPLGWRRHLLGWWWLLWRGDSAELHGIPTQSVSQSDGHGLRRLQECNAQASACLSVETRISAEPRAVPTRRWHISIASPERAGIRRSKLHQLLSHGVASTGHTRRCRPRIPLAVQLGTV